MNRSFTLIELTVVIGIIALLTALILPNYRVGQRQFALQRSAHKLSQDLRRAQEMAMSAAFSEETEGKVPKGGYGIIIKLQPMPQKTYILFGDKNGNGDYDAGSDYTIGGEIKLEKGIFLESIQTNFGSSNSATITFIPPDPEISIKTPGQSECVEISLAHEQNPGINKSIYVNKAGLITVE